MKKLFSRSRSLLLFVALVLAAATCTVSAAHAASSPNGAGGIPAATSHAAASPNSPASQCIFQPAQTCSSTNPTVLLNIYYYGDTADCTFSWDVYWGDGDSSDNLIVVGPADGYLLLAQHTFAAGGTYSIAVTGEVLSGNCVANDFTVQFTLLLCSPQNNPIWYGYVVCGDVFTSISAKWTVPAAHGGGNKKAAFWVGLGGVGGTSLEQDGTESNVVKGKAVYTAWWEIVPQNAHFLKSSSYPVTAGDVMSASVTARGDTYYFKLVDNGRDGTHHKWSYSSAPVAFVGGGLNSAEAIVEDTGQGPLTNFGTVTFSNVIVNNNVMATYAPHKFIASGKKVSVSGIQNSAKFTATFIRS